MILVRHHNKLFEYLVPLSISLVVFVHVSPKGESPWSALQTRVYGVPTSAFKVDPLTHPTISGMSGGAEINRCKHVSTMLYPLNSTATTRDGMKTMIQVWHVPSSSSSFYCAGQRLTPHYRTLEVRPGRITKKLELKYDYDCESDDTNSLLRVLMFGWDVVIANNE